MVMSNYAFTEDAFAKSSGHRDVKQLRIESVPALTAPSRQGGSPELTRLFRIL